MTICTYDNPNTMHRECWQNGKLLYSYSANVLTTIPPEKFFFGANIGPWNMEQLVGDKRAMERPQEFVDNIIEIKHQGCILVNYAEAIISTDNYCAIEIDLESKHAEVWGHFFQYGSIDDGQIGMHLGKTEHSMHFDTDTEMPTEIVFPKHDHRDGWQIFATDCCKYTVRICLINKRVK